MGGINFDNMKNASSAGIDNSADIEAIKNSLSSSMGSDLGLIQDALGTSADPANTDSTSETSSLLANIKGLLTRLGKKSLVAKVKITRPNDTPGAYTIGDIINTATDANTLIPLDLTSYGVVTGDIIQFSKVMLESSNGAASPLLSAIVQIFNFNLTNSDMISGGGVGDHAIFKPLGASILGLDKGKAVFSSLIEPIQTTVQNISTGFYGYKQTGIADQLTVGANNTVWIAVIANNAYVPIANEDIYIKIEGYLL
ncbi:MAG TPA: hypothetical protein DEG71_03640 [Clostridiales bacterium]|nr:hypothetical protein [Clostridiales bacterium]